MIISIEVPDMHCPMCETYINDCVRKHFDVKKVVSNSKKGTCVITTDMPIPEKKLRDVITQSGYTVGAYTCEATEPKKKFPFFK